MRNTMNLLKCPHCTQPLILEIAHFFSYNISADGKYIVQNSLFPMTFRIEKILHCNCCGKELIEWEDWEQNENGNIVLKKK